MGETGRPAVRQNPYEIGDDIRMKKINKYIFSLLFIAMALISIQGVLATCTITSPTDESTDTDGDVSFVVTCAGFTNQQGANCTLDFQGINPGDSSTSGTLTNTSGSNGVCTVSLTSMPEQTYKWSITLTNGTQTNTSTVSTVTVDTSTGGAKGGALWLIEQGKAKPGTSGTLAITGLDSTVLGIPVWLLGVLIVVVIIIVVKRKK